MKSLLRKLSHLAMDCLYPSCCELCESPLSGNPSLCRDCSDDLPRIREPFCSTCGECYDGRIDAAFSCKNCSGNRFSFEFARPVLRRDPRSLDLVHRFKYGRQIHLVHSLGFLLTEALHDPRLGEALEHRWPLIPVPLHPRRMRQRHFNQSEELARVASRHTSLPVVTSLHRTRDTGTQTALGRKARQKNLKGAFHIAQPPHPPMDGAILVDDVFTTGSTLHECAATLKKAGYRSVIAITLLRG